MERVADTKFRENPYWDFPLLLFLRELGELHEQVMQFVSLRYLWAGEGNRPSKIDLAEKNNIFEIYRANKEQGQNSDLHLPKNGRMSNRRFKITDDASSSPAQLYRETFGKCYVYLILFFEKKYQASNTNKI